MIMILTRVESFSPPCRRASVPISLNNILLKLTTSTCAHSEYQCIHAGGGAGGRAIPQENDFSVQDSVLQSVIFYELQHDQIIVFNYVFVAKLSMCQSTFIIQITSFTFEGESIYRISSVCFESKCFSS